MGFLTTHVLDTARGMPAHGVKLCLLWAGDGKSFVLLHKAVTNADGRVDAPLLGEDDFAIGDYVLDFYVGEYFATAGLDSFLTVVTVRFIIAEDSHYHVPLLVSPYGYSTYRGS